MAIAEPKRKRLSGNRVEGREFGTTVEEPGRQSNETDDLNNLSVKLNIVCRLLEDGFSDDGLRIARSAKNDLNNILRTSSKSASTH